MDELVNELTENGTYANVICLLIILENKERYLNQLKHLGITGKKIETLVYKCCNEFSIDYIGQTLFYLRSGFLDNKTIHDNLESDNPIPFLDKLLRDGEDWDYAFERCTGTFYQNLKNNKQGR